MKREHAFFLILIVAVGWAGLIIIFNNTNSNESVNDFESCVEAGYPVLESYPRQCRTSEGKTYTEVINGENLQFCPDDWFLDEMPCICPDDDPNCEGCQNREYFIVDGERRELEEFNVKWVEENCGLEKTIVY